MKKCVCCEKTVADNAELLLVIDDEHGDMFSETGKVWAYVHDGCEQLLSVMRFSDIYHKAKILEVS